MSTFGAELKHAMLRVSRKPSFHLVAVLTLALGMAGTVSVFSLVGHCFLSPLPYPDAERLVLLWNRYGEGGLTNFSPYFLRNLQPDSELLEETAAIDPRVNFNLSTGVDATRVSGARASHEFFPLLGASFVRGGNFHPGQMEPGGDRVAILSYGLWVRYFGAEPDLQNLEIRLDGDRYEAVGVLEPGFSFLQETDVFVPLALGPEWFDASRRGWEFLTVLGRLREGISLELAGSVLNERLHRVAPDRYDRGQRIAVESVRGHLFGDFGRPLFALLGASLLVLLLACCNVANLVLGEALNRRGEFALQQALGVGRSSMVRRLLLEGLAISLLAGLVGILLGGGAIFWIEEKLAAQIPALGGIGMNLPAAGGTFAILALTGLFFGLLPGLTTSAETPFHALRRAVHDDPGGSLERLRGLLVATQIAIAMLLLAGLAFLYRTVDQLWAEDPGFKTDSRLAVSLDLPPSIYTPSRRAEFLQRLEERLTAVPGVREVGMVSQLPLSGRGWTATFRLEDRAVAEDEPNPGANMRPVSNRYFEVMGIPLREGESFVPGLRESNVVWIDEALAQEYWPDRSPVGTRIVDSVLSGPATVVGVVGSVKDNGLHLPSSGHLYFPVALSRAGVVRVVVLSALADPAALLPGIVETVRELDPALAVFDVKTLDQHLAESISAPRLALHLLVVFGIVGLSLAALGVYAVTTYGVIRRRREFGIRLAVGARPDQLVLLVLSEVVRVWLVGAAGGLLGVFWLGRLVEGFLFQVTPRDPVVLLGVILFTGTLTAAAGLLPALRAGSADPQRILRQE